MHLFVKPEMLEGDNMIEIDKYNRKIDATRRSLLKKLSRTCIFHLKRFDYDLQTGMKKKLNSYFTYPMSLNLKPWTMEGIAEQEGRNEEAKFRPDNYYEYQLVGILIHTGSADSGHYYSIIKERTAPYRFATMR
jgi:ubiquitin C-terminal hydrolase